METEKHPTQSTRDLHAHVWVTRLRILTIMASASFFGVGVQGFLDNLPFLGNFHWGVVFYGLLGVASTYVLLRASLNLGSFPLGQTQEQ